MVIGALPRVPIEPLVTVGFVPTLGVLIAILVLICFAGIVHLVDSREPPPPQPGPGQAEAASDAAPLLRRLLLPAVLLLALVRGYSGPVLHDWPFMRGVDHYSHAVMATS